MVTIKRTRQNEQNQKDASPIKYNFQSRKKRDAFYRNWVSRQGKPIKDLSAGAYIGDTEILAMAGKSITLFEKGKRYADYIFA